MSSPPPALVAAGETLAPGFLHKGSPAQPVRALTEKEVASIACGAQHCVRPKDNDLEQC